MQRSRNELLAGSGFAVNQDGYLILYLLKREMAFSTLRAPTAPPSRQPAPIQAQDAPSLAIRTRHPLARREDYSSPPRPAMWFADMVVSLASQIVSARQSKAEGVPDCVHNKPLKKRPDLLDLAHRSGDKMQR